LVTSYTDDFQVKWKDPADANQTWMYDAMHFPKPLVPLGDEVLKRIYGKFMNARVVLVNGYSFSLAPTPMPPTEEMLRRGAHDMWTNEHMPRVRAFCERVRKEDYEGMSLEALSRRVVQILDEAADAFGLTMTIITTFMGPTFAFVEFMQEELGPEAPQMVATLLQGFENGTAAAGAGLSDMAEEAAKYPAVAEALRSGRYEALDSLEGGKEFLQVFNRYLDEFGWRAETWGQPELPTWSENPRTPLMLIGRYLEDPDRSPAVAIKRAIEQREQAVREIEVKLSGEKLAQFRQMLSVVQAHVPVSEGRALWQLIIIGSLRVPFLALGRKLVAAGGLQAPDDVFYLTAEEIEAAPAALSRTKDIATTRRGDYERWSRLKPPPFIGAPPDMSNIPPEMVPLLTLFFGAAPPQIEGKVIKGQAASKGVVRARARIIHNLSEGDRLQAGEVLVCQTTAPPWTPLFAIAGAVVTDSGGVLSHSAICAREYAIPCVVATQVATHVIPDGAMISVDGTKGIVTIEG
jgi:phosphohistidine swiveling domain-containing protein